MNANELLKAVKLVTKEKNISEDVIYDGVEKQFEHNFIKSDENWTNAEKFSTKIKLEHDPINDRYIVLGVNDDYFLYINQNIVIKSQDKQQYFHNILLNQTY